MKYVTVVLGIGDIHKIESFDPETLADPGGLSQVTIARRGCLTCALPRGPGWISRQ